MKIHIALLFLLGTFTVSSIAQSNENNLKPWKESEIIQYISTSGSSPQNIIGLDNNSSIILHAKHGVMRELLNQKNIEVTESQIKLLKTWRLIEEKDKMLQTTFPILDSSQTQQFRSQIQPKAPVLVEKLTPLIEELKIKLEALGRSDNAYSITFSYILDGLIWDEFEQAGLLKERNITVEKPFWDGEVWALYPKRNNVVGTNTISDQGVQFKINWTYQIIPKMVPFVSDFKNLTKMVEDYITQGEVINDEPLRIFEPYNLFDAKGKFTVPIIKEDKSNPLFTTSTKAAQLIAREVPVLLNLQEMQNEYDFRDQQQTLIIAYHELMWEVINTLVERNIVEKPKALANPSVAVSADIADLIFIVDKRPHTDN